MRLAWSMLVVPKAFTRSSCCRALARDASRLYSQLSVEPAVVAIQRPNRGRAGRSDRDLFLGRIEIKKGRSHVIVNLPANVFRFGLSLP